MARLIVASCEIWEWFPANSIGLVTTIDWNDTAVGADDLLLCELHWLIESL
jgi:hypothetical protein